MKTILLLACGLVFFSMTQNAHALDSCANPSVLTTGPFGSGNVSLNVSAVAGATSYWMEVYAVNANGTLTFVGGSTQQRRPNLVISLQGGTYKLQYGSHCGTTSSTLLESQFTVTSCATPNFIASGPYAAGAVPLSVSSVSGASSYWLEVYQVNASGTLSFVGGQPKNPAPTLSLNLSGGNYKIQYGAHCATDSSPLVETAFQVSACTNPTVTTTGPFKAGSVNLAVSAQAAATNYWMEVYSVNANGTYNYVGGQTQGSNSIAINLTSGNYALQYSAQCPYSTTPLLKYPFVVNP